MPDEEIKHKISDTLIMLMMLYSNNDLMRFFRSTKQNAPESFL